MSFFYKLTTALALFLLTVIVSPGNVFGGLTGTYTIGPGGDYETFTAAANDLMTQGVGEGGVTFLVTPGNYPERFSISYLEGTSENKQVVFKAHNGDVFLNGTGTSATSDAMVLIHASSYITFDGINISCLADNIDERVEIGYRITGSSTTGAKNNTIKNAAIYLGQNLDETAHVTRGVDIESAAEVAEASNDNNKLKNLYIDNVSQGIRIAGKQFMMGAPQFFDYGNVVRNCVLGSNQSIGSYTGTAMGIHARIQYDLILENNTLDSIVSDLAAPPVLPAQIVGISVFNSRGDVFNNNIKHVRSTNGGPSMATGMTLRPPANDTLRVYNNFISNIIKSNDYIPPGSDPSIYIRGIFVSSPTDEPGLAKIIHNTIVLDSNTPSDFASAAFFTRRAGNKQSNTELYNNIFINHITPSFNYGGLYENNSYAIVEGYAGVNSMISDHNNIYVSDPNAILVQKGRPMDINDYYTIADWHAATGNDEHSISKSVNFEDVAAGDLHLAGASVSDPELAGMFVDWIDFDIDYDPRGNPPGKGADEYAPSDEVVNLSGTVTNADDNSPLQGVEITVGEFQVFTNASGGYSLSILPGDYDLDAFKEDFEPFSMEIVIPNEDTVIDFQLIPIPIPMSLISGTISGSDAPGVGIEGAEIVFVGDMEYPPVYTDGAGVFEVELPADILYHYRAVAVGYEPLEGTLTPPEGELDMGTLILEEFPFKPLNVQAVSDEDHVLVSWEAPVAGMFTDFRYDGGVVAGQLGYQGGTENSVMGTVYRRDAILEEVSWYLTGEGGPHPLVNIFVFALDEAGLPDRNEMLYVATNVNNTDGEWNSYTLGEPLELPDGFFIGVSAVGFLGLAFDAGDGDQWPFVPNTQFATHNFLQNDFVTLESMNFEVNFLLRGHGIDFGPSDHGRSLTDSPSVTDMSSDHSLAVSATIPKSDMLSDQGASGHLYASGPSNADMSSLLSSVAFSSSAFEDDPYMLSYFTPSLDSYLVSGPSGHPAASRAPAGSQTRVLESYQVYRLLAGQEGDSSEWSLLVSGHSTTEYTDTEWTDLPEGEYLYAVLAEYTDGVLSAPVFSNPVAHTDDPPIVLTVRVTQAGEGIAIEGALVSVTHAEGDIHEATTGADGEVAFADLEPGMYSMLITKSGYHDYEMEDLEITESMHMDVELDIITGIDSPVSIAVEVYPNPAREGFTVQSGSQMSTIEVFDVFGRRQYLSSPETKSLWVDTSNWKPGLYLVRVHSDTEIVQTIRIQIVSSF